MRKHNLLGLKNVVVSHVFPVGIGAFALALGFYTPAPQDKYKLKLVDGSDVTIGDFELSVSVTEYARRSVSDDVEHGGPAVFAPEGGWVFSILPEGMANFVVREPGRYRLFWVSDEDVLLGQLLFFLVDPPPLSPERIAAIRSNPSSAKAVRISYGCNKCNSKLNAYAGLERSSKAEAEGWTWYENLEDAFVCSCGATTIELSIVRRNMHGLLGTSLSGAGSVAFIPLYEEQGMQSVRSNFAALLGETAPEETFQKFIESNPLLLHAFAPERLFVKPPILTAYKGDFGILTPQKELVLIELERPDTKILKKDGGVHSELQHAFDQARDWLHTSDEHRAAVLEGLGLSVRDVGSVRAVVIAGRDKGQDENHLRKLKGNDFWRIRFLTYDDLLGGLDALLRAVSEI